MRKICSGKKSICASPGFLNILKKLTFLVRNGTMSWQRWLNVMLTSASLTMTAPNAGIDADSHKFVSLEKWVSSFENVGRVKLYRRSVDRWGVGQNLYIYKQVQSCFTGKLNGRLRLLFRFSPRRPTLWAKKLSALRNKKIFLPSFLEGEKKFCLEGTKDISILQDFVKAKIEM